MLKLLIKMGGVLVTTGLLMLRPALASDTAPGHLVSAAWLKQQLGSADLRVLDASPLQQHRAGHIAGAVSADMMVFGPTGTTPESMEKRLRAWGIGGHQRIVIVDEGGTHQAPRLFWDLAYHGLPPERLYILNGGMSQWRAAGGALTTEPTAAPAAGTVTLGSPQHDLRVKLPDFLAATADPRSNVMIEALDPTYYYGGAGFFNRKGHVPHATLMPPDDFFNADKTFKSAAEMQRMLDHLGVRPTQQVHTYCGGGGAAAVPFFALKYLLGYPRVALFQESQLGWLQDERELPVWTYHAPQLLRGADWLKAWGSPMARMFKLAQVSVVDVRAADAYRLGHVPLAVNLPAQQFSSVFKPQQQTQHQTQLQAWAAQLAQAGVRHTDEAVVVSDGGLTGDAALAFLALESLGQQRVSIFTDSLDRWVDRGLDVARPAATAGAAGPIGPVTPYAAKPRQGLIVNELAQTQGRFPKVFVASGAVAPAHAPVSPSAGTVVHLPYTQLLQADGLPKPAKDIWALLEKAGVPRYAEIVLFADAPGDAAVNYVIFRLMGFADVKVWAR